MCRSWSSSTGRPSRRTARRRRWGSCFSSSARTAGFGATTCSSRVRRFASRGHSGVSREAGANALPTLWPSSVRHRSTTYLGGRRCIRRSTRSAYAATPSRPRRRDDDGRGGRRHARGRALRRRGGAARSARGRPDHALLARRALRGARARRAPRRAVRPTRFPRVDHPPSQRSGVHAARSPSPWRGAPRATAERIWDRTPGAEPAVQMANQMGMVLSKLDCKPRWRERLSELAIPALVVHGRRDPFFPVGNGEALAREIPGARLLVLEQAATAIPDAAAGEVATAMLAL